MTTRVVEFERFGQPEEVLREGNRSIRRPGSGEVAIRMLRSPINPSDLGSIGGSYGQLPSLPAIPGREGVGEIAETGPRVEAFSPGQLVLPPDGIGCWREAMVISADSLIPVPAGVPLEQAAMGAINPPTACLLLKNFVQLQPGDWVIQNAANSAVGHYVIQLCRARGFRTINLVRHARWVDRLQTAGADAVLVEGPDTAREAREIAGDRAPRLGLNSVGGASALTLIKTLGPGGTVVTFGGMTGELVRFPTRYLIFNDIRLVGFWLHRWKKNHAASENRALMDQVFELMARGILHAPVEATYPLSAFRQAVTHASNPGRKGKILLGF